MLIDETLQLHIGKMREWGHLIPGGVTLATYIWSRNGQKIASVQYRIDLKIKNEIVVFDNNNRGYHIPIVSRVSNLGKGRIYYFKCPYIGKRARILYSTGGRFMHRDAFPYMLYESQTKSKKYRALEKQFSGLFELESLYSELHRDYLKTHYRGKPTRHYTRLVNKIKRAKQVSLSDYKNSLLS